MSKQHIREQRVDSGSIKKYNKTKIKQQMYNLNAMGNQGDNITRNDVGDIGYKT